MKVYNYLEKNYVEDPIRYWHLEKYENLKSDDLNVFVGCDYEAIQKTKVKGKKIVVHLEEVYDPYNTTEKILTPFCDKLLTLSKTASILLEKRDYIFFPLNTECLPKKIPDLLQKKYDVCYTGNLNNTAPVPEIYSSLAQLNPKSYAIVSFFGGTHKNVSYLDKLDIISKSKITVTHNSMRMGGQLKSRQFEAAFCKSLILCCEKYENYMQPWFTKDEHYITYKEGELLSSIQKTLEHIKDYEQIVERAYQLANEKFSCEQFVKQFL